MAWTTSGEKIQMAEGDWGVELPITISGMEFASGDSVAMVFKTGKNGETLLTKTFTDITDNKIILEFTEEETALFPVGSYVYRMDAYQDGNYLCNLITSASFKVVDVA